MRADFNNHKGQLVKKKKKKKTHLTNKRKQNQKVGTHL